MQKETPIPLRLAQARKALGISQKQLGVRLGMEPNSASGRMNHYETGCHTPDYQTLKRIAEESDVPLFFYSCESDITAKLFFLVDQLTEQQHLDLIADIQTINPEAKSSLIE